MPCARCFPQWFGTFAMLPERHWSYVKAKAVSIRVAFLRPSCDDGSAGHHTSRWIHWIAKIICIFWSSFLSILSGIGIYNTRIKLWSFVISDIHKHHDQIYLCDVRAGSVSMFLRERVHLVAGLVQAPQSDHASQTQSMQMLWSHLQRQSMAKRCF